MNCLILYTLIRGKNCRYLKITKYLVSRHNFLIPMLQAWREMHDQLVTIWSIPVLHKMMVSQWSLHFKMFLRPVVLLPLKHLLTEIAVIN